jgi:N-acyl-D-amino-acid deacylase
MLNLLIKGGTVVDGKGSPPNRSDIRIVGGIIAEIGPDLNASDERVIDATGAYVTPGFIDSHTHLDPTLFWDAGCDPLPLHGVTTVVAGNCSLSLAPVRPEHRKAVSGLYTFVEDLSSDVLDASLPWSWTTHRQLDGLLSESEFGVNVSLLVGHTPLRLYVMGEEAWDRVATDEEIVRMVEALDDSMAAGARGMSTSFFDSDADGRPVPSTAADDRELGRLLDVLAGRRGILEFIPDLRLQDYSPQVARVAALCGPRGVTATWNGIFYWNDRPTFARELLDTAATFQGDGIRIFPQISPRPLDTRINWDGGMSFIRYPKSWMTYVQSPDDLKKVLIGDEAWRADGRTEWDAPTARFLASRTDRIRLLSATSEGYAGWVGRSLRDLVEARGGHPSDVLADWVSENDLRPEVVLTGIGNSDPEGVAETLVHPASIVSNSDAGAHVQTLCAHGDTTCLLTTFVRDREDMTVEHAVWELTGRQADVFGLDGRGTIGVGAAADITIFALEELRYVPDELVHDLPGGAGRLRRPWGGYRFTITGGRVIQEGGVLTGDRSGKILHDASEPATPKRTSTSPNSHASKRRR